MSAASDAVWSYWEDGRNLVTTYLQTRRPCVLWNSGDSRWASDRQTRVDIERMLARTPANHGVGIITGLVSGIACVDDDGGLVQRLRDEFPELRDFFDNTVRQRTGSGRLHYLATIDRQLPTWRMKEENCKGD